MSMHEAVVMDSAIDELKECISQINPLVECLEDVKKALDTIPKARHIRDKELARLMFRRIMSLSDQIVMLDSDELMTSQKLAANISKMARDTLKALADEGGEEGGYRNGLDRSKY